MSDVFARLLIGYILALPFVVPAVIRFTEAPTVYAVAVRMTASAAGHLQVFYDTGQGFSEARSAAVKLRESAEPQDYRVALPPGRYLRFRIDPGTLGGDYVIERVAILQSDEKVRREIPLGALTPGPGVKLDETPGRLIVHAAEGLSDPQVLYMPARPLVLSRPFVDAAFMSLVARVSLWWIGASVVVWLIQLMTRPAHLAIQRFVTRVAADCETRPRLAIVMAASLATVVSLYPVIFLGKSLVSPNNGFVRLLYQEVPYVPGSTDITVEDTRGTDVGATMVQGIPHSLIEREALAQGEMPLWNRYHSAGLPLWAQGLAYLGDPLHWLTLVVRDPALGWDLKFIAHRFVFSAGIGLASFAAIGTVVPALVVAVAAPFVGVYTFRFNHPAAFALTYAPWVLLGWFALARTTDRRQMARALILLAIASCLVLLASTPKEGAMMLLGIHAAGALTVLVSATAWPLRLRRLAAAMAAGLAVMAITAPHWWPFLDNLQQSFTMYDTPYAMLGERSYLVGLFLSPLVPGLLRPGLHLLALVLILACVSAPRALLQQRAVMACAGVALACIALAFGAVPASLLTRIPFVKNIGHVNDVFITMAVPLLLIAGAAGVALLAANARRAGVTALITGIALAWLYSNVRDVARDDAFEPWAVMLLMPIAMAMPLAFRIAQTQAGRALPLVASTMAVVVLVLPGGMHAESGIVALDGLLLQPRPRADLLKSSPVVDAIHADMTDPVRVTGIDWTLHSGSQRYYGLEGIGGPDPLAIAAFRDLLDAAHIKRAMVWFTEIPMEQAPQFGTLLDVLNVGYLIARADRVFPGFEEMPVNGTDRNRLGRRTTVWPRAFFVDGVSAHTDSADFLRLAAAAGKPIAAVQTTDQQALAAVRDVLKPSSVTVPARNYALTANTTAFHVRAPAPGVAVLNETFLADDFRATLNGQRVPYFRVNQTFKGVVIPTAGEWDVRFEYRPRHWDQSLAVAALGMGLLAVIGVMAVWRAPLGRSTASGVAV